MTPDEIIKALDRLSLFVTEDTNNAIQAAKRHIRSVERLAKEVNVISKGEYIAVNEVREILFKEEGEEI